MKYALGLYSVRDELAKDFLGTLKKVKVMGYDAVEFFGGFSKTAQEVKAALDETGLVCCGWHTNWDMLADNRLPTTITYNKVLGNTELVVPGLWGDMVKDKAAWLNTAKVFCEKAKILRAYGMNLAYHNHDFEFKDMEGGLPINYFLENTCDCIGFQFDNGNAFSAGPDTDIYSFVIKYPNRIRTLHHKPYSIKTGYATMIGEDDIDWGKFFKLCKEHQNIEWHIIEYECEEFYGQLEGVEKCIQAIKKLEKDKII